MLKTGDPIVIPPTFLLFTKGGYKKLIGWSGNRKDLVVGTDPMEEFEVELNLSGEKPD